MTRFTLDDTGTAVDVTVRELIVAGWAGREQAGIDEHIEELRALGVKPPSSTPLFYRVSADLLTQAGRIQVLGNESSGEVEVVLIGTDQGTLVAIGSDHTDREAEAWSVAHSKQVCAKPVSQAAWWLDDVIDHWDQLTLASDALIDGQEQAYQRGGVTGLLHPRDLLARFGLDEPRLAPGVAMLCGTLPVISGHVRPAEALTVSLIDPVRNRRLSHRYEIDTLPVVS
ncbi:hypothetical protein BTO32_06020 [Marinobacter lutaoensis]|uniref:DUF2848 domain-containing protein n=1 Tax=Marinobacter lutaoensis TaxID=135739 RepID=A0A1V2DVV4_9GAMM|nr:DUF2848 domain-containing protein [Marinobacter lutaoensis]ONF44536.1 hypothetical protein BTO32_06020 [Marinobacter lutaoensis]